jgi:hypothetical protein
MSHEMKANTNIRRECALQAQTSTVASSLNRVMNADSRSR